METPYYKEVWGRRRGLVLYRGWGGVYNVGLWKAIRKGWGAFKSKIYFIVSNRRTIRF